ncbi:hypothetical protein [Micromonospora sp. RTP1Z1]|uniref:hypothetical protein n=1 Tax=Micromonospora sp. RTP1Z1 TaxID=2994043 RepID=UPI0029C656CB|nr:hypothetical protein [Micromonospora sp. RTP1Z1]
MKTFRTAVSALVVCAALSACGGQGGGDATPTSPTGGSSVTTPPGSTGPAPSTPPSAVPPTKRPPNGPSLPPGPGGDTLTGTVSQGVEPNCLLLDGYLLVGGPRDVLRPGATVTVTGRSQPDMMTTCQQGTPFVVESARPA